MSWWSKLIRKKEDLHVGVCLSGGGARGVIHIGMLKALKENDIKYHSLSGTSMGAIVSLLAGAGLEPDDMMEAFIELDMDSRTKQFKLLHSVFQNGLHSLYDKLRGIVQVDSFEDLKYPCYFTASELKSGKPVIFTEGDPVHAALASASIPLIFHPYEHRDKTYVDGGLFNNFPVDPLLKSCTHIIGSHANHMAHEEVSGLKGVADRVFQLAIFQNVRHRMELCDWYIDPKQARSFPTLGFDPRQLKELFQLGYEEACGNIDALKRALKSESEQRDARKKFSEIVQIENQSFKGLEGKA